MRGLEPDLFGISKFDLGAGVVRSGEQVPGVSLVTHDYFSSRSVGCFGWCFFQGGVLSRSRLSQYLKYLGMKGKIVTH